MKIAIITSTKDPASMNIREHLLMQKTWTKNGEVYTQGTTRVYTLHSELIYAEHIDKTITADLFIFASKHQSASKIPSLTVHAPGNFGAAALGGQEKTVCYAPASYIKTALILFERYAHGMHYEIIQEATHHGPCLEKPCMFIEIGSTEEEWINPKAGKIVAQVILEICTGKITEYPTAVGIGGLHHCPNFKKIQLHHPIAIGHVCAKYALESLTEAMIKQAMEKTVPCASQVIVDWKGLGEHKDRIKTLVEEIGVSCKKTHEF